MIQLQSKPRSRIELFNMVNPTFSVYIIVLCPENASKDTVTGLKLNSWYWQNSYIPDTGKVSGFWMSFVPGTHFSDKSQNDTRNWRQNLFLPWEKNSSFEYSPRLVPAVFDSQTGLQMGCALALVIPLVLWNGAPYVDEVLQINFEPPSAVLKKSIFHKSGSTLLLHQIPILERIAIRSADHRPVIILRRDQITAKLLNYSLRGDKSISARLLHFLHLVFFTLYTYSLLWYSSEISLHTYFRNMCVACWRGITWTNLLRVSTSFDVWYHVIVQGGGRYLLDTGASVSVGFWLLSCPSSHLYSSCSVKCCRSHHEPYTGGAQCSRSTVRRC